MGARIPPNERPRRGGIHCEFCGRAAPSAAALLSHQTSLHSQALKEKARLKLVAKSKIQKPEQRKLIVKKQTSKAVIAPSKSTKKEHFDENISKTAVSPKPEAPKAKTEPLKPKIETVKPKTDIIKISKTDTKPKVANTTTKAEEKPEQSPDTLDMDVKNKSTKTTSSKERKVDYKCPKCDKLFPVLFAAQKHIQKYHSGKSKGEKVAGVIKPILLELCIYCNEKFSKPHNCPNRPDDSLLTYECLGCQQQYKNNKLFDMHVVDVHGFQNDSMFFPSEKEFNTWKSEMETQTKCEYVLMGKYNGKRIFRCSEHNNSAENIMVLCPSSIVLNKSLKGFQINFYPSHYGHEYLKYELKDCYKTYSITDLIQQAGYTNGNSDDDLYLQFKTLMESIVLEAAKINIGTLKTLMSRATDMMSSLQEYDEDEEMDVITNHSTISISTSNTSIKDDNDTKPTENLGTRTRKRALEETETEKSNEVKKVVKSSGNTNTPVKSSTKKSMFSLADDKDSDKILKELDGENRINKEKQAIQSPSSFNDSYKDFIMNVSKTTSVKKKNIVKTKMGQYKGPSPKKGGNSIGNTTKDIKNEVKETRKSTGNTPKNKDEVRETRNSILNTTKDIEYEVREREDDCNILILKI